MSANKTSKFSSIQQIGRALMLPIAVLPIAGLLLRLGQDDLLGLPFVAAAGGAIFDNLGLLFAIGIAVGFAKENHGAAGLAGAVGFFVTVSGMKAVVSVSNPDLAAKAASNMSIPIGIVMGLLSGWLYNKFKDIKLPEYLAFFGGRRFIPIASGTCGLFVAVIFGYGFPWINAGLGQFSLVMDTAGNFGLFVYGALNRLLIVTGLHHIINNVAWFILGDFNGATGDLKRFFAGDPTAGAFMAGFFPVMMFGLPAACLAMYTTALPEQRLKVGGLLVSMALTSFLTGVTEPIEFSFMFLSPLLYAIHAVLTGLALVTMNILDIKLGFGFSAGLFDYVINWKLATNPAWLIPVGLIYGAIYYFVFYFVIKAFNLKTLGREEDVPASATETSDTENAASVSDISVSDASSTASQYVAALGGTDNIRNIDSCTTRLRLDVNNGDLVDETKLKALGARGVMKPGANSVQVIIGAHVEQVENEIKAFLQSIK